MQEQAVCSGFFRRRMRGATGFNYALLVGLIAIVALLSVTRVGEEIARIFGALFGEREEVILAEGEGAPIITFAQAQIETEGITITTGMPPELPQPEPVDLTNIQFTVTDDTTPPEEIITAVSVILDPEFTGHTLDPVPDGVITGEGEARSLSLGALDQQDNINAALIVTLTATDADNLTTEAVFPVRISGFIDTLYVEVLEEFPALFADEVDVITLFTEVLEEFPAQFEDDVDVETVFTEVLEEFPAVYADDVEVVSSFTGLTEADMPYWDEG